MTCAKALPLSLMGYQVAHLVKYPASPSNCQLTVYYTRALKRWPRVAGVVNHHVLTHLAAALCLALSLARAQNELSAD